MLRSKKKDKENGKSEKKEKEEKKKTKGDDGAGSSKTPTIPMIRTEDLGATTSNSHAPPNYKNWGGAHLHTSDISRLSKSLVLFLLKSRFIAKKFDLSFLELTTRTASNALH
ncbi:hypothetical protein CRE_18094 [Caenorhabditis remanei]|uniref:Uncharacterized protein n=1 Tax=Caenorhabditis remanei TaxID=31234 RepID=E3MTZ7_CAERE|nr:hypothetical protein CRE_18094 [Caenorhabditis remanei]